MIYVIIPNNHPLYIHPYNIYSRKEYLEKKLNIKISLIKNKYYECILNLKNNKEKLDILEKFKFYLFDRNKNIWRSNI